MSHRSKRFPLILFVSIALIFTFTLFSMTVDRSVDREGTWYETLFLGAVSPIQRGTTYASQKIKGIWNNYIDLVDVAEENQLLKQKQKDLESKLLLFGQLVGENNRLRELLKFQKYKGWESVPAHVIAHNPQAEFCLLTIDQGHNAGLMKKMPVISSRGLVGQIYRVGQDSAQVLLLTDPTSAVDARLDGTEARGLIRGRVLTTKWDRRHFIAAMEYLDHVLPISVGGMVVSSGLDGVFPEGVPIGTIQSITKDSYGIFQEAEVLPLTNFMTLREVLVITNWQNAVDQ